MILTLYYMYATFLQWWRLGTLRNKLSGTLNSSNALLICDESIIFDTKKCRSFENLLFRNENRIGCTVVPKQKINLSSQWVVFPRDLKYFPIYFKHNKLPIGSPNIYILCQAVLEAYQKHQAEILQMENFGELIAWKVTDHFEAIIRTDMDKLTKLVHFFSQTDCDINHELKLLKVETIDVEGKAKKIKFDRKFSKDSTLKYSLAPIHWKKFVCDVKDLYSKIRDATNPKITIDNGTPKPEDLKKVPVSEVKPIKKDKKSGDDKDRHTLEVNCSDYRRHKSSEHSKKDKEKAERHKIEKDKTSKKETTSKEDKPREEKDHKSRDHKKHKSREEPDSSKHHKKDKDAKTEAKNGLDHENFHKRESEVGTSKKSSEVKSEGANKQKKNHKSEEKHNEPSKTQEKSEKSPDLDKSAIKSPEEPQASTSAEQKQPEKLKQESRTSSKEKKLVRSSATCEDAAEDEKDGETGQGDKIPETPSENPQETQPASSSGQNGSNKEENDDMSPTDSNGAVDKDILRNVKPPNILVYADSTVAKENVKEVLSTILNRDKYVVYDLPLTGKTTWFDSTALVVVCGAVEPKLTSSLMKYLLNGGQLLCLCSDLLYSVLHTFTTAEVREHELVRFSYGKWRNVKMMHHIFCYQASPAKKQFSKDSDASNHSSGNGSSPIAPRTPSAVEIQHGGKDYTIQVQVLGAEETWQTPSLLLATVKASEGRAIFSQVHLEIDPSEFIEDESRFEALKDSNQARLEILKDILSNHLDLDCSNPNEIPELTPAYFLGKHELKMCMLNETHCIKDYEMKAGEMHILFCGKEDRYDDPDRRFLPILIHACPQNFNTVSYFETLDTKYIGRLVIYSDVLISSQPILTHNQLTHGVAVICRQQLGGVGRSKNLWLSPPGSALFSVQLHISSITNLGRALPLVQHLQMVAVVKAVKRLTGNNRHINLGIKWPNDLYVNGCVKIGGLIVTSVILGDLSCVNVGCGINLSNSNPTTSINQIIRDVNEKTGSNIPEITHEKFFAQVFNETEKLINRFQIGDVDYFYDYYYEYWLHNDSVVTVTTKDGKSQKVQVEGIDDHGFLKVRNSDGKLISVQPDGNSFDMMKGLIYPK